jgi:rhamnose utilization protein RhaD (predicted bifunctional aldolase and dehydrogenase)
MPTIKEGYKNIMGAIPIDMHEKISHYNRISAKSLNVSKAIEQCLAKEVKKIEHEAVEFIQENHGIKQNNDTAYNATVADIQSGAAAPEVYSRAMKRFDQKAFRELDSAAYLPLLPVNRMHLNEEKQKVCFFVDKLSVFAVASVAEGLRD